MNLEKTNTLETIARLITIFTAICYLIGVFAVNSYLYYLGISPLFSPLKPRFIYTGIVVLSSLGFSFFFPMVFIKKWQNTRSQRWWKTCSIKIFPLLIYFVINYLFVMLVNNLGVVVLTLCFSIIIVLFYGIGSWITGAAISLFLQVVFPVFSQRAGIYD